MRRRLDRILPNLANSLCPVSGFAPIDLRVVFPLESILPKAIIS